MGFVNTIPYISNPIEEFADHKFVNWERDIYPRFKDGVKKNEIRFFTDIIMKNRLKSIIDFGVGGGIELSGIIGELQQEGYLIERVEANEVDDNFVKQASALFKERRQKVLIHKGNWLDLSHSEPAYEKPFDFGFLTGNSLTAIGGGTREYTRKAQQIIVNKFAELIRKDGYLFIDSRNYDYIRSLMNLPKEKIFSNFKFNYTVYYQGFEKKILVFPAYISDTLVVLHFYDKESKTWSKADVFPIYQKDMLEILSKEFVVENIFYDFETEVKQKSLFIQYLARRK